MFSLFSKPQPTETSHQRRDKMAALSLENVVRAERMLDNALTRKQTVVETCVKEELADLTALEAQVKVTALRIAKFQGMVSGEIVIPEETPVVE